MAQQVNRYLKFPPPSWEQPKSPDPKLAPKTFTVVGSDPLTGRSVVSQPGAAGTLSVRGGSGLVGFAVPVQTAETDSGGRKLFTLSSEFTGEPKGGFVRFVGPGTPSGSGGLDCDNNPDPPPPPAPEPEASGNAGDSGGGGGGGGGSGGSGSGGLSGDPGGGGGSPTGGGNPCDPQSDAKWYNGSSCPAGMAKLGEATLAGGAVRSLCRGNGPPPECNPPQRWVCDSVAGSCIQSTNGIYETKEACEAAGCEVIRYSCVNGQCAQTEGGTYATYDDCLASGCQVKKWKCTPDGYGASYCTESYEGTFDTAAQCNAACPTIIYRFRVQGSWTGIRPGLPLQTFDILVFAAAMIGIEAFDVLYTGSCTPANNCYPTYYRVRYLKPGPNGLFEEVTTVAGNANFGVAGLSSTITNLGPT